MRKSVLLNGTVVDWDDETHEDGTVQLQPRRDMFGRAALGKDPSNFGFGGYFKFFIFVDGKRRRLTNGWRLFPNKEHHLKKQQDKPDVVAHITAVIDKFKGRQVNKVSQGWEIQGV
jgi:hypothetical protein